MISLYCYSHFIHLSLYQNSGVQNGGAVGSVVVCFLILGYCLCAYSILLPVSLLVFLSIWWYSYINLKCLKGFATVCFIIIHYNSERHCKHFDMSDWSLSFLIILRRQTMIKIKNSERLCCSTCHLSGSTQPVIINTTPVQERQK